jgi:hypothetical protein
VKLKGKKPLKLNLFDTGIQQNYVVGPAVPIQGITAGKRAVVDLQCKNGSLKKDLKKIFDSVPASIELAVYRPSQGRVFARE